MPYTAASTALTLSFASPNSIRVLSRKLDGGRCADAAKAQRAVGTLEVDAVEQEHVEVHVQVQRPAEALDQGHCPRLRGLLREPGLADQVRGET